MEQLMVNVWYEDYTSHEREYLKDGPFKVINTVIVNGNVNFVLLCSKSRVFFTANIRNCEFTTPLHEAMKEE